MERLFNFYPLAKYCIPAIYIIILPFDKRIVYLSVDYPKKSQVVKNLGTFLCSSWHKSKKRHSTLTFPLKITLDLPAIHGNNVCLCHRHKTFNSNFVVSSSHLIFFSRKPAFEIFSTTRIYNNSPSPRKENFSDRVF